MARSVVVGEVRERVKEPSGGQKRKADLIERGSEFQRPQRGKDQGFGICESTGWSIRQKAWHKEESRNSAMVIASDQGQRSPNWG